MGTSTDAMLWYGVTLDDEAQGIIEETVAQHPRFWTDDGEEWFVEHGLAGVSVVTHCHIDNPLYGIAVRSTVVDASRGNPQTVDGRFAELHPLGTYREYIHAALEILGIERPTSGIGWCLASMTG